ncbi:hypothetical protein CEXT_624071 [Caerostris extrusa]|uniref:Uncharacterized protein n=1 Tax=Caerostris extrusa TaxID=172846 RepID=A0AAV4MXN6_CAEEX|nr:hypothetical protein CEXT_624071 [Caerostris extrusa]
MNVDLVVSQREEVALLGCVRSILTTAESQYWSSSVLANFVTGNRIPEDCVLDYNLNICGFSFKKSFLLNPGKHPRRSRFAHSEVGWRNCLVQHGGVAAAITPPAAYLDSFRPGQEDVCLVVIEVLNNIKLFNHSSWLPGA